MNDIAPLMQWRDISGSEAAHRFDLLVCRLQAECLKQSSRFDDLKSDVLGELDGLRMNLGPVRTAGPTIAEVRTADFWAGATVPKLEEMRGRLRGVMQYRQPSATATLPPKVIDVPEDPALFEREPHVVRLEGLQLAAYRNRVEKVLRDLFETSETLQRIRRGQPVSESDLEALTSLVLAQDPSLDLHDLAEYYPECAGHLDQAIRGIIGLDAEAVHERFTDFVREHPTLNSTQIRFLSLLQNHIARNGSIEIARLYEPPFTTLHTDSIDGLFPDEEQALGIIEIIESFRPPQPGTAVA
jgi:type I restriction enzyme R subunit